MRATGAEQLQEEILRKKAEQRVGTTLRDKWHLDSLIGLGGMGAVFEATHRNGMRGAVKLLYPERAADEEVRRRFLREGYLANKVDHEGAVRVLDDDEADGTVFLVMELLEGMTLEQKALRAGGVLGAEATMLAVDQLLETLAAAHAKGIIHRDLKPANLFVTTAGRIKILDYGIAGLNEPASEARTATQTGIGMGTPAFMAPEQARGRWDEVDAQSDLWSVGATMFWLLTGTTVHDEGTVQEQIAATFTVPPRPVRSVEPSVPLSLAAVIDRALRLEKKDRWKDARAMRRALRTAYGQIKNEPMPEAAHAPRTPEPAGPTLSPPAARMVTPARSPAPAVPIKNTLTATEAAVVAPAAPSRRRVYLVAGAACVLAALAFSLGFAREREPSRNGDTESAPRGSASAAKHEPSSAAPPAPEGPPPVAAAPSATAVPATSTAAPSARAISPVVPGASAKPAPLDAGKGPDARPKEDSIF